MKDKNMANEYSQVRYWVNDLPKRGITTFALKEAENQFPKKPVASVRRALARLSNADIIQSVWRGFYVITLPEYGLKGVTPPIDYIDQLMRHLGCGYYIALLTAASYSGANHQAPQVFQIICDDIIHIKNKNGVKIEPIYKKRIPIKYLKEINTRTASVRISTPELTAVDLLLYSMRVGGINRVATILYELAEVMDFTCVDTDFFIRIPATAIQRLGFLLEIILDEKVLAADLYYIAKHVYKKFLPTPLVSMKNKSSSISNKNKKWNIIVNYEVESDL